MIGLSKEGDYFVLILGSDLSLPSGISRIIPLSMEEANAISKEFNRDFAISISEGNKIWSCGSFRLTSAPDFPYGWTDDVTKRTILHYGDLKWHMYADEISEIGHLVRNALGTK